ncbi:MAG: ATP-binding protein [Sphingomonadaceae bacterium]
MHSRFEIGPFLLDADAGVLTRAGVPTPLGARGVAVLHALVERAHEYVAKADILEAAWPGLVVEENNLAVQISAIRRVLMQETGGDRWIETLARRGYRFVGPVKRVADGPLRRDTGAHRGALPRQASAFVGRERELDALQRLLPQQRLLTLTGPGGIGKTRLALRLAEDVADTFDEAPVWIELAALSDPAQVAQAVAQGLGVQEPKTRSLLDALQAALRSRRLLLIVDNCEHVLEGCARLIDALLRGTRGTTIVATSREPLRVAGEQLFPVSPLTVPDPEAGYERIAQAESVRLFVDRARHMQPDFCLTPELAPVVADLCVHLDGIPLALELAAARVRALSVAQIAARLGDRFRLLTAGTRVSLPRHQTLRATFDWSYDLLSDAERIVLRRLAVFPGSFSLEAVCDVAADDSIDDFAVVDILSQLVTRSLVVAEAREGDARYRLLETMRAYAAEKLAEAGESERLRLRHAEYFRRFCEHCLEEWISGPERVWQARYLPEIDSVRAALECALDDAYAPAVGIALAGTSAPVWSSLSRWREAVRWLQAAIDAVDARTPPSDEARLWLWLGNLIQVSEPTRGLPALERAVLLYRGLDDRMKLAEALIYFAWSLARVQRYEESKSALAEALSLAGPSAPPKLLAFCFSNRAFAEKAAGNLSAALVDEDKALASFREAGAEWGILGSLGFAADTSWAVGDLDGALAKFLEYVPMLRAPRFRDELGFALANLSGVRTERGELDEALATAREALPLLDVVGRAWIFMDHFALRLALSARLADAARLEGYADAAFATRNSVREPNEARAQHRVVALLRERMAKDELARLLAEGAALRDEEALRIAAGDRTGQPPKADRRGEPVVD